jgi:hypothetical protein
VDSLLVDIQTKKWKLKQEHDLIPASKKREQREEGEKRGGLVLI